MGKNAGWEKIMLMSKTFYWNMLDLPEIQINYIYSTIKMKCISEFNLKKLLKSIFCTKKYN